MTRITHRKKLTGYCTSCGGDCFDIVWDDGSITNQRHICPRKRMLASEVVVLKIACDKALQAIERRPWARTMMAEDYSDLKIAIRAILTALGREDASDQAEQK